MFKEHNPGCNCCEEEETYPCELIDDIDDEYPEAEVILTFGDDICTGCDVLNGTYILPFLNFPVATLAEYRYSFPSPIELEVCDDFPRTVTHISLYVSCVFGQEGLITVAVEADAGTIAVWSGGDPPNVQVSGELFPDVATLPCDALSGASYTLLPP